jgi:hypothetical protein
MTTVRLCDPTFVCPYTDHAKGGMDAYVREFGETHDDFYTNDTVSPLRRRSQVGRFLKSL